MKEKILKVNSKDNVIVALTDLKKGTTVQLNGRLVLTNQQISRLIVALRCAP